MEIPFQRDDEPKRYILGMSNRPACGHWGRNDNASSVDCLENTLQVSLAGNLLYEHRGQAF